MTEYVMVGRDRWERVQDAASELLDLSLAGRLIGLSSNDVADAVLPGDLDPIEPIALSDADREALIDDLCDFAAGRLPIEGDGIDYLLTHWHIVRRTPEPGA